MKKHPLAAIINFCSNESRFLPFCLEEVQKVAREVIIPVCDHFFDGTGENRPLLDAIYASFPDCLFLEYPFIPEKIPHRIWRSIEPAHFWHSLSRFLALPYLDEEIETVLFLDADEIVDAKRFAAWLDASDYQHHTALKLSNYWYFREACHQALSWEDSIVLAQRRNLRGDVLLHKEEREAIYNLLPGPKRRHVLGVDGAPMFHHYSWVRTEEEMLKKVQAWGHKGDRDWSESVKKEFSTPFSGIDFVHGYRYQTVPPRFPITLTPPQFTPKGKGRVIRLSPEELLERIEAPRGRMKRWLSRLSIDF